MVVKGCEFLLLRYNTGGGEGGNMFTCSHMFMLKRKRVEFIALYTLTQKPFIFKKQVGSKKSPTEPTEWTPKKKLRIKNSFITTYLRARWDSVPFNF